MPKERRFCLSNDEIVQIMDASDSEDDENKLLLDEEDIAFIEEDLEAGELADNEIIIEDVVGTVQNENYTSDIILITPPNEINVTFKWKSTKNYEIPNYNNPLNYEYSKVLNPTISLEDDVPDVLDVFSAVVNFDVLLDLIIVESKLYCEQNGKLFSIEKDELKAFLGIIIVMSIHILPTTRHYWSTQPIFSVPFISNVMSRNRFEEIRSNLHFSNNLNQPSRNSQNYDRAFKIRPILNHFNEAFSKAMSSSRKQSIDEHMVKFKGHNIMKQYMKDKPICWGFKLWCRCDSETGYLYQTDIYTGRKNIAEVGLGESVIQQFSKGLDGLGIELYFDNFFNNPLLLYKLKTRDIKACGTLRSNRKQMPKFPIDKTFKRGDYVYLHSHGVSIIKWMDNRAVFMGSNFISPNESNTVKRRQSGSATKIDVKCPTMISLYNKGMGGVDLMDQKKVYYEYDRKSKTKFYLRLFFDLFDLSINNAYIVYDKISLANYEPFSVSALEFKSQLATQLIGGYTSRKRPINESPIQGSKIKKMNSSAPNSLHRLIKGDTRRRCVQCSKRGVQSRSNSVCAGCNLTFCFTNTRNCFEEYHK